MKYIYVGLAGAAGALTRYWVGVVVGGLVTGRFPWAILLINITGSFLLGFLTGFGVERGLIPTAWRAPLSVGFVGAYTTFSTWTLDTVNLLESGHWALATANVAVSVVLGMAAVRLGLICSNYGAAAICKIFRVNP